MYVDRCMLDVWKIGKTLHEYYSSGKCCNVVFCGVLKRIYQSFTTSRPTRDNGFLESVALLMFFCLHRRYCQWWCFSHPVYPCSTTLASCSFSSETWVASCPSVWAPPRSNPLTQPATSSLAKWALMSTDTFENLQIQFFWWWKPKLRVQGFSNVCPFARIV